MYGKVEKKNLLIINYLNKGIIYRYSLQSGEGIFFALHFIFNLLLVYSEEVIEVK